MLYVHTVLFMGRHSNTTEPLPYLSASSLGLDQFCWHNFENNRHLKELGIMLE